MISYAHQSSIALFVALSFPISGVAESEKIQPPLPNIIVMMADDMGMGDTSAYQDVTGNSDADQIKTPTMERLARVGIRFTDAHSPSSRCTATRYSLLTGRYSWRTRLKYSVLWGPQGNPLIERDRPTLATLLQGKGYRTGMSGKWHVGLTYREKSGKPAKSYRTVDLQQGIEDGPLNHGFDFFHGTSRSIDSSALQGWLSGDRVSAATGGTKVDKTQYVKNETGSTNYQMAMQFVRSHLDNAETNTAPFFLYYASHSNHGRHAPCKSIEGRPVAGHSHPGGKRSDFVYENDVALGALMDFLAKHDDPRRPGAKLIENTLVIFTSDNGAEISAKTATGPFRSHKGSAYEGGHRVPLIASWPLGGIGDGQAENKGQSSDFPVSLVDFFATFAELTGSPLPEDGAEDSFSILKVLRNQPLASRPPLIHHDHMEAGKTKSPVVAWLAIRWDDVDSGKKWKLFVDEGLLIEGKAHPRELYELGSDPGETKNRIGDPELKPLVEKLTKRLQKIHDAGGIRSASQ